MVRTFTRLGAVAIALGVVSAGASAAPTRSDRLRPYSAGARLGTSRVMVVTPTEGFAAPAGAVSGVIYLNRCSGGCMVTQSDHNDARNHLSTMIQPGTSVLTEFSNSAGQIGAAADAEWGQVVQCLKEVYSPFNVAMTDQQPPPTQTYTELMIAGRPTDLGFSNEILGIAPVHLDCNAYDNAIAFAFANHQAINNRVFGICWTAAQEAAHNFGLDHEFQFVDGQSACNDPMTYRTDCGGQKFFRNKAALCGENAARPCLCPGNQNSHQKLLSLFGEGTPLTAPPSVSVVFPGQGAMLSPGQVVQIKAKSQRGIARVELWLNGRKWAQVAGAPFGPSGQGEATYTIPIPQRVPDSVLDIVAKAFDDLGGQTESATVTAIKGSPCATADTCLMGQNCDAGKCYWDAPAGELGATCSYNEFCVTGLCAGDGSGDVCTQTCILGSGDACPGGFDCVPTDDVNGICLRPEGGGCCQVDRSSGAALWFHGSIAAMVVVRLLRRRRREGL